MTLLLLRQQNCHQTNATRFFNFGLSQQNLWLRQRSLEVTSKEAKHANYRGPGLP